MSNKYKIWAYIFLIVGIVGIFDLATRSIVLETYKIDVGYAVLGLFFALKYLVGTNVASQITTYAGVIFGFAPILLAVGYFFLKKAKAIDDPSEENQKKLKRAKIIAWVVATIIGVMVLLGMGFAIYNSVSSQSLEKSSDSEVSRTVVKIRCGVEDPDVIAWQGSGVLISKDGLVLTNAHVIPSREERGRFKCLVLVPDPDVPLNPNQLYPGHLDQYFADPVVFEGTSEQYDLALLRITGPSIDQEGTVYGRWPREFPAIQNIGKCDKDSKIGDRVMVYGFPAVSMYDLTATEGVLSTIVDDYTFYTSAKIDAGNSGGLAVNEQGCFVGVSEALTGGVYEQYGVIISERAVADFLNEFNVGL